jgi:regulator of protease activity HflC (stomatin/prohibitin superfamily)
MSEAATKLEQAIQQAASQYFRLVILAVRLRQAKPPPCSP